MKVEDFKQIEFKSLKEEETRAVLSQKLSIPIYVYGLCVLIIIFLVVIWWVF
jgi:hypothetical protein